MEDGTVDDDKISDPEREDGADEVEKQESSQVPPPSKPKLGMWGVAAAARFSGKKLASTQADDPQKKTLKSVAKRVNRQIKAMSLIKKWTQMTSLGQFAKDEDHLNYIRDVTKQTALEIPAPIQTCIREEVLGILQDTLKQYRIELGKDHPLTHEMQTKMQEMKEQVMACLPKEGRRDTFFKKLSTVFLGNEQI